MALNKLCILVVCLVVCTTAQQEISSQTSALPLGEPAPDVVDVSNYRNEQTREGFVYAYQTSDNSYRIQEGMISNRGTDNEELVVTGSYTYRSGDYATVVSYMADKYGYRAKVQIQYAPILFISQKLLENLAG